MRMLLLTGASLLCATVVMAGSHQRTEYADSISVEQMQEVVVSAVRAPKNAPFAVANIDAQALGEFATSGRELPYLFARTPGVMAWSDNGLGIGTSYLRIRGAGDSRINVTLDGMPLNSPEDQCVFWANMNSYAALLGSVQIQRGVGTSTNGDGAFGGSVSLGTRAPQLSPSGELTVSDGSYGTWRVGGRASTGLLWGRLVIDGACHVTSTDGYLHGTEGRAGSYYGGATWMGRSFTVSYKNIGNFETTGQAWNGVIAGDYDGYAPLADSYDQLVERGMGRWNSLYENIHADADGRLVAERYRLKDGRLWRRTTDRFWQNHSLLSAAFELGSHWRANAAVRYTRGHGYYTEFKHDSKLTKYGIENFTLADGSKLKRIDFIRQKGLTQDTYGALANACYYGGGLDLKAGISYQHFEGNHYGYLTYMGNDELEAAYMRGGRHQYYDSDATKRDLSAYVKATVSIGRAWSVFADAQLRHVAYAIDGYNDKYYTDADGRLSKHWLDIDKRYNFFNPKAGVAYTDGGHRAYASVALSHREPERNNFTDNGHHAAPRAESLVDCEAGYEFDNKVWNVGVNLYYMRYHNQFVQTGQLSDIGEALTTNIRRSYRCGAELTAGVRLTEGLTLEGNLALSVNRVRNFDEVVEDWTAADGMRTVHHGSAPLAYSPSAIGNIFVTYRCAGWQATWHTAGVSRMYLDNSGSRERSLPGYHVSDLSASYTFDLGKRVAGVRQVELGAHIHNIFDRRYAANGFVWYQYYDDTARHSQLSYMPDAGRTVMGTLTLRF